MKLVAVMGALSLSLGRVALFASILDTSSERPFIPLRVPLVRIGTILPRQASEIASSHWMLNCTPYDRHFGEYRQHKDYIGPLGIKKFRLLAGWARCEQIAGEYDFSWLDEIVDDLMSKGIATTLETDYGNPIYPGGGGSDLAGGFPSSEEALSAWDRWVEALARHFSGRVRDWAMWNEPDLRNPAVPAGEPSRRTPAEIAIFNVRTARIIKRIIPSASIGALSLATTRPEFFEDCVRELKEAGGEGLFSHIIYHGYTFAPESAYANVESNKLIVAKWFPGLYVRQGENGCPSELTTRFALPGYCWSEYSQAKWDLRRMLGDLGHDVDSTVFSVADFNHIGREINRKGLLRANADNDVVSIKRAYYAVQNCVSVFDEDLLRVVDPGITNVDVTVQTYEYRTKAGHAVYAFWKAGEPELHGRGKGRYCTVKYLPPSDSFETAPTVFDIFRGPPMTDPVWVDLVSGGVYAVGSNRQVVHSRGFSLVDIPCYDSPCLICERAALKGKMR